MTASELRRKLKAIGCAFEEGKKHTVIFYRGQRSLMPRHAAKEIKKGTLRGILRQLSISEEEL